MRPPLASGAASPTTMTRCWPSSAPSWVCRPSSLGGCRRSSRRTRARSKRLGRRFTRTCGAPCMRRRPRSRPCSTPLRSSVCTRGLRNVTARSPATRVGSTEEKEAAMKVFSPTPVAYPIVLLIATVVACDTGSGVERAVTGAVRDRTILLPAHSDAVAAGVPRHHDEVLAELRAELGLSADQSARVQEILAAHQGEIEAAWAQVHANLRRRMQETTELEAVLDSAQIERLHAWLAERHGRTADHAPGQGHTHADAVPAGVPRHHDEVLTELGAKLGLSAEQSARVREIFARHHA